MSDKKKTTNQKNIIENSKKSNKKTTKIVHKAQRCAAIKRNATINIK